MGTLVSTFSLNGDCIINANIQSSLADSDICCLQTRIKRLLYHLNIEQQCQNETKIPISEPHPASVC